MTTNASTETTSPTTPKKPDVVERTTLIINAWTQGAPAVIFGNYTCAEFGAVTDPARFARESIAAINADLRGKIADKNAADRASRLLVNKVISAVKASDAFGPESALYRAMGFVPPSERKAQSKTGAARPRPGGPGFEERLNNLLTAWKRIDQGAALAGMTLEQFTAATRPSLEVRESIAVVKTDRKSAVGVRHHADATSRSAVSRVVNGVIADPAFGNNSPLYRAMGFVPAGERKAPTRKKTVTAQQ